MRGKFLIGLMAVMLAFLGWGCPERNNYHAPEHSKHDSHDDDPHNLAHVKCRHETDKKDVKIEVQANAQVLGDPNDEVVFVCSGESVYWSSFNKNIQFKVTFLDQEKSKRLFKGGHVVMYSNAANSHGEVETTPEVVGTKDRQAHEYRIDILGPAGDVLFSVDPHVIPMGK